MTARTVAEAWDEEARGLPSELEDWEVRNLRRMFYRGALAAATTSLTREQLMAELIAHGRSVGTAAESARA